MKKRAKQKGQTSKAQTALEAVAQEAERRFTQSDGRVVERNLRELQYRLWLQQEHLAGLQASIIEVRSSIAKTEAQIAGLSRVLERRR